MSRLRKPNRRSKYFCYYSTGFCLPSNKGGLNEHCHTMTSQLKRLSGVGYARAHDWKGQYGMELSNVGWVAWISTVYRPTPRGV